MQIYTRENLSLGEELIIKYSDREVMCFPIGDPYEGMSQDIGRWLVQHAEVEDET